MSMVPGDQQPLPPPQSTALIQAWVEGWWTTISWPTEYPDVLATSKLREPTCTKDVVMFVAPDSLHEFVPEPMMITLRLAGVLPVARSTVPEVPSPDPRRTR